MNKLQLSLIFLTHMQYGVDAEDHPELEISPQLLCKLSRMNVDNTEEIASH